MVTSDDLRVGVINIVTFCANECERQQSGEISVPRMLIAYRYMLEVDENIRDEEDSKRTIDREDIMALGYLVDPIKNSSGFRNTPVTFASGGSATKHEHISRQIILLVNEVNFLEPKEWIKRFLEIHPFADGNGRVAAILYNWLKGDLNAPQPLPEFDFV